jgi:putative transposase
MPEADEQGTMSAPRRILPGKSYLLTRRCLQRLFLLAPSHLVRQVLAYCMAEAAAKFGIELLAWVVMSNHYHAVVRDPHAKLPAFIERFHKLVAKCMNAHYDRWENFWSSEETCVTLLPTEADVLEKVVYTLVNPIAARLVGQATEWPGLSSIDYLSGKATTHERPSVYFSKRSNVMPTSVTLQATCPMENPRDWARLVRGAVAKRERELADERAAKRQTLLGVKGVLATKPFDAPRKAEIKRKLRPAVACGDAKRYKEERKILKGFRIEYARVLQLFLERKRKESIVIEGINDVVFPPGTYRMRLWGARCSGRGCARSRPSSPHTSSALTPESQHSPHTTKAARRRRAKQRSRPLN